MIKKIQKKRKLFRVSEKGYVTGIVAILLPILIVIVGFGVDWNYSNISKTKYSTFGMEILSHEPIYKGTPEAEIKNILNRGYNLAGMEYNDIKITPLPNGSEFKAEVIFKSNSLFSNISSGTWTSTFVYPYTDDPVVTMGDRPFYIDVALRTNTRAVQEAFSYYISTMPGFESWANAKYEFVNNIGAAVSTAIEYHDIKVTLGSSVQIVKFPMWKFTGNSQWKNRDFQVSIGFFGIGRTNGIGQWFRCNVTEIKEQYNLPNLAIPAKVYMALNGANYSSFELQRTIGTRACANQRLRQEVEKIEFPRGIAVNAEFLRGTWKTKNPNTNNDGIEVIMDSVQFQENGIASSFSETKFDGYADRSIWSKFTIKGTQFAYQDANNINWALWGILSGSTFDQTKVLSFNFVTTGLKVTLMGNDYQNDRYGTRIGMDQWNKFYLVNGIIKPEYSGYKLAYIDGLHLTRAQMFI